MADNTIRARIDFNEIYKRASSVDARLRADSASVAEPLKSLDAMATAFQLVSGDAAGSVALAQEHNKLVGLIKEAQLQAQQMAATAQAGVPLGEACKALEVLMGAAPNRHEGMLSAEDADAAMMWRELGVLAQAAKQLESVSALQTVLGSGDSLENLRAELTPEIEKLEGRFAAVFAGQSDVSAMCPNAEVFKEAPELRGLCLPELLEKAASMIEQNAPHAIAPGSSNLWGSPAELAKAYASQLRTSAAGIRSGTLTGEDLRANLLDYMDHSGRLGRLLLSVGTYVGGREKYVMFR